MYTYNGQILSLNGQWLSKKSYIPTSLIASGASRDYIFEYNLETGDTYQNGIDDLRSMNASFFEGCIYCGSDIYNDYHNGYSHVIKYELGGTINYIYNLGTGCKAVYGKPVINQNTGEIYVADYRSDGAAKIHYKDAEGNWSVDYMTNARTGRTGVWDIENGYIFMILQSYSGTSYNAEIYRKQEGGTWEFVTRLDERFREDAFQFFNGYLYIGLYNGELRKYDYDLNYIETLHTFLNADGVAEDVRHLRRFFDTWVVSTNSGGVYILDGTTWRSIYIGGGMYCLSNISHNGYFYFGEANIGDAKIYKTDGNTYDLFWNIPSVGESTDNINFINLV